MKLKQTSFLAFLILSPFVHAKPIKVLLLDGQNNHNWKATTPVMVKALEKDDFCKVTVSTSPPKNSPLDAWEPWKPKFSNFDVTLTNYNGELWPEDLQKSLTNYVRKGGSFVVVHAANNAFSKWEEYNTMIGLGGWGGRSEQSGPYLYLSLIHI